MLTLEIRSDVATRPRGGRPVNVWLDEGACERARAFDDAGRRRIEWDGIGTFAFEAGGDTVRVWPVPDVPPAVVHDVFGRSLQPIILQALGRQAIHAAGVAVDSRVIALGGRSGSGKSTLAYALGQRPGYRQHADDAVAFDVAGPEVCALATPFRPRLRPASREHLAAVASSTTRVSHAGRLEAVVLLEPAPGRSDDASLTRLEPPAAFSAVLAHAYCFDLSSPSEVARLSRDYLQLVATVPVYQIAYRPDLRRLGLLADMVVDCLESSGCLAGGVAV